MLIFWHLFLAFFIPGIVGYGGGPSSIPLIQIEVVNRYQWLSVERFGEILALGNALPGPIATKMAGYVGYEVGQAAYGPIGGIVGAFVALFATVAPSLMAMVFLLGLLYKYKDSPRVKRMTQLIRPTIAILLAYIAYEFFATSFQNTGLSQTLLLGLISFLLLEHWKVHPAIVILGALLYGAGVLSLVQGM